MSRARSFAGHSAWLAGAALSIAALSIAALSIAACSAPASTSDAGTDASIPDTSTLDTSLSDVGVVPVDATALDGGPLVTGFVIDGPALPGAPPTGTSHTLDFPSGAGTPGATLGSHCTSGDDCTALGAHAACYHDGASGFCTIDCDTDPEGPSVLCPTGSYCFVGMRADGGRLCLPTCASDGDCATGTRCGGPLFQFNAIPSYTRACLPECDTDADCNADSSALRCDPARHACVRPRDVLGASCASDADCHGLDPNARCMRSTRDASRSYCTVACDPGDPAACSSTPSGGTLGPCALGYATTSNGAGVAVCLGACGADADCQVASDNTCNFVPSLAAAVCTIACTTDADCIHGTCDVPSGDCRETSFWSPDCASDSNCPGDLCVRDFHRPGPHNCSHRCTADADCPSGAVCVTTPVADDGAGQRLPYMTGTEPDVGFCAPSCTPDAGVCADPTTTCLMPAATPEIDFAGSGAASHSFCWR